MKDSTENGAQDAPQIHAQDDGPPEWFKSYTEAENRRREQFSAELDKRFEGFRKKYIEPKSEPAEQPMKAVTPDDLKAAMRLGQVSASLPEDARKRIDQLASERGYQDALMLAEMLAQSIPEPANGPEPATRVAPKGMGASPAPSAVSEPASMRELMELKESDPARFKALMDPNHPFDPTNLPYYTR